MSDEPLLSISRLVRGLRFWLYFELRGLDLGLWRCLLWYRREVAWGDRDYPPAKLSRKEWLDVPR